MAAAKVCHGATKDMSAAEAKAGELKFQHVEETTKFEACQVSNIKLFSWLKVCVAYSKKKDV